MEILKQVWNWKPLNGKKHWLAIGVIALVYGLEKMGYLTEGLADQLQTLFMALGIKAAADHRVK